MQISQWLTVASTVSMFYVVCGSVKYTIIIIFISYKLFYIFVLYNDIYYTLYNTHIYVIIH